MDILACDRFKAAVFENDAAIGPQNIFDRAERAISVEEPVTRRHRQPIRQPNPHIRNVLEQADNLLAGKARPPAKLARIECGDQITDLDVFDWQFNTVRAAHHRRGREALVEAIKIFVNCQPAPVLLLEQLVGIAENWII
ncbi:MAG TPA: hypothetical protein VIL84_09245 [Devosiaceae bacterium]